METAFFHVCVDSVCASTWRQEPCGHISVPVHVYVGKDTSPLFFHVSVVLVHDKLNGFFIVTVLLGFPG